MQQEFGKLGILLAATALFFDLCLCPASFSKASGQAKGPRMVSGGEAQARVTKLNQEIIWHKSLDSAMSQARRENKPIFFVHMLGQLDGLT